MAARAGVAYAEIVPKLADGFSKDLQSQFTGPVEESGSKIGSSLGKVAGLIGGAFAAKGIFDFAKGSIEQATESNKIAAQTEAVIKSTGGAAKVTAGQISDLATAISNKTGIDDEAIQKSENLLLTFTGIHNQVGKNNDVFNQATKIAVDMGAALGGDASSSAIQLGKALNDPVKGITALTRVGVTFTDQQKEQIGTMVKAGDTMGAQKIILAELNKEFGGSAQAQATAGDKLKVVWGNVQEQIGNMLLPILNKVATFLADNLPAAVDFMGGAFSRIGRFLEPVVGFFKNAAQQIGILGNAWKYARAEGIAQVLDNIFGATGRLTGPIQKLVEIFLKTWSTLKTVISAFKEFGLAGGDFAQTIDALVGGGGKFTPVLQGIFVVIENVTNFVKDHFQPILIGLGVTIALLFAPLATLIAALVLAYTHFDTFRNVVNTVVDFLVNVFIPAVVNVTSYIIGQFSNLISWVQQYWPQISEAIGHVMTVIQDVINVTITVVTALWRQWGDDLMNIVGFAWGFIRGTVENAINLVRGVIQTVLALINGDWGKAWDGLKAIVGAVFDQIKNIIGTVFDVIKSLLGGYASTIGEVFSGLVDKVVGFFLSIPGKIGNLGKDILSKLIPDIPGSGVLKDALGAVGLHFAGGGIVPGPVGAPRLAVVHGGETVTPANGRAPAGAGLHIGEVNLIGARATPSELSGELGWLMRTSGR